MVMIMDKTCINCRCWNDSPCIDSDHRRPNWGSCDTDYANKTTTSMTVVSMADDTNLSVIQYTAPDHSCSMYTPDDTRAPHRPDYHLNTE